MSLFKNWHRNVPRRVLEIQKTNKPKSSIEHEANNKHFLSTIHWSILLYFPDSFKFPDIFQFSGQLINPAHQFFSHVLLTTKATSSNKLSILLEKKQPAEKIVADMTYR